jgi:sugar phosphate isomerase/epimerase
MYRNLNPALIGAVASFEEHTWQARKANFEGMDIDILETLNQTKNNPIDSVKRAFKKNHLRFGGWYLPTRWKEKEELFLQDLKELRTQSLLAKELGCTRATTWLSSFSEEFSYEQNFEWHRDRLTRIAEILEKNDCKLALEFVGTKTFRANHKYEFIHNLDGLMNLVQAIDMKNVGLLMDSWHWYVSGGTVEDLKQLTSKDVFYVHINDAPKNKKLDEQIDIVRCLPGETGIINIVGFLQCLKDIHYLGPVTPEPFSERLKGLSTLEAICLVGISIDEVWRKAGFA